MLNNKLSFRSSGKSKLKYREIRSKMIVFIARVANMVSEHDYYWCLVWVFQAEPCELQCHIYKQYTFKCPELDISAWKLKQVNIHLPGKLQYFED